MSIESVIVVLEGVGTEGTICNDEVESKGGDDDAEGNNVTVVVTVRPKNPASPPSVVTITIPTVIVDGTAIVVGTVVVSEKVLVVGIGVNVVAAIVFVMVTV